MTDIEIQTIYATKDTITKRQLVSHLIYTELESNRNID